MNYSIYFVPVLVAVAFGIIAYTNRQKRLKVLYKLKTGHYIYVIHNMIPTPAFVQYNDQKKKMLMCRTEDGELIAVHYDNVALEFEVK